MPVNRMVLVISNVVNAGKQNGSRNNFIGYVGAGEFFF